MAVTKKKATKKQSIENVFGTAASTGSAKKKTKSKSNRMEVEMDEGFESFVALILVEKALDGVKKQLEGSFKESAYETFIKEVNDNGKKPDSIVGVEGDATAMFQFKKRGAGFTEEVANQLEENGISFEKEEKVPERFIINPDVLEDQAKLGKLAQAIEKLNLGFDVIQKQEPTFKFNIDDTTIAQLSKLKKPELQAELIKAVSLVAVSQAKIDGVDAKGGALEAAMKILKENGIL
jgi:hypothetical protein